MTTVPESERRKRGQTVALVRLGPEDAALVAQLAQPDETAPSVLRRCLRAEARRRRARPR